MYKKSTLENGIRVITETMPGVRSISIGVLIGACPRDETPGQNGLAHLVEHVMFQGTNSRDAIEIARMMDTAGGQMGAFTAKDYTCYHATVLDDYRTYALDLLGDILLNSIFPPNSLEMEKEAVLREIDATRDVPDQRAHALLKAFVWPHHPLGRPIAGLPDNVRALTREDVIYFVHKHYLPDSMIIAAAGNLEHGDFVGQTQDAFWRMLGRSESTPPFPPACGGARGGRPEYQSGVTIKHMAVSQAYFSIGIRASAYAHPARYSLHVLNNVLGGGISSRLYRRLREKRGLVYNISSEYNAYGDDGLLIVEGATAPEYLIQVLGLTLVELWKLITGDEPVDEDELWKAKMQIRGQHLIAAENSNTCMSRLATQEFYFGRHIPGSKILGYIEIMDSQILKRLCDKFLIDALSKVTISVVGPEAPEHYDTRKIEELMHING